ncbi:MAG: PEP-CTERM sorting domain-containing protein [Proteobacteria bacterium]|nr:PEP-CTERM sorting domain-containing protein [Pseudomonadota bacterium]
MKRLIMLFTVVAFLLFGTGFAFADVLDFEDLNSISFTNPYHGFNFTADSYAKPAIDDGNYRWDGTNGSYSINSKYFNPVVISTSTAFSLDSLFVNTDADHYTITILGYLEGSVVASTSQINDSIHSFKYFVDFSSVHDTTEWDNIDKIEIFSGAGGNNAHVCIDDITYNSGSSSAVPAPATMLLLGSGIFSLAGLKRRFNK